MRILFVDDEPSVLEGIENRLRRYRKQWSMAFSIGAHDALKLMESESFDVVVSDMRMPQMDGAELLTRVRDKFSDVLRIVLTGQTGKEQILRSLSVAHRVLNKPCDAVLLESAINEALLLQKLISNKEVRICLDKIENLPTLPSLHTKLTKLIKSGDVTMADVSDLIVQDPIVSARILQLVNSSFIRLERNITSIRDAVSYLGLECVRGLVLNLELFSFAEAKSLSPSFSIDKWYQHSFSSARTAQILIEDANDSDLVYSSALLHGIGQVVLAYALPEDYERILLMKREQGRSIVDVELDVLGFTHADVSAYLLSLWDLPFSIVNIVGNCYTPSNTSESHFGPVGVVHAAAVATSLYFDPSGGAQFDNNYLVSVGKNDQVQRWAELLGEAK